VWIGSMCRAQSRFDPQWARLPFVVLMAAEFGLAGLVFRRSLDEQLAGYASVPGAIGLAAQIVFAAFPDRASLEALTRTHYDHRRTRGQGCAKE
jgi:hypothetical protein